MKIPRVISQTWHERNLPEQLALNLTHNKAMAPGWTFTVYSDEDIEDFIMTAYGSQMLATYRKISPAYGAARADLFRYLLIYRQGGIYIDIKARLTLDPSQVILDDDDYLLGRWANCGEPQFEAFGRHREIPGGLGEFQQWFLVASPEHPFLESVVKMVTGNIEHYLPSVHGVGKEGVLKTTGPIAYTKAILPIQHSHPYRLVRSFSDLGLQYSCLTGNDSHQRLFKKHYSQMSEPVVTMNIQRRAVDLSRRAARRLQRLLPT